jgi:hypothetical protein
MVEDRERGKSSRDPARQEHRIRRKRGGAATIANVFQSNGVIHVIDTVFGLADPPMPFSLGAPERSTALFLTRQGVALAVHLQLVTLR